MSFRGAAGYVRDFKVAATGVRGHVPDRGFAHGFRAVRPGVQVAVAADLIADQADVDLQGRGPVPGQGQSVFGQHSDKRRNIAFQNAGFVRRPRVRLQTCGPPGYIDSFSAIFRIWTPWTRDAPPRMALVTCTASVISARLEPFSRQAWVYASIQ